MELGVVLDVEFGTVEFGVFEVDEAEVAGADTCAVGCEPDVVGKPAEPGR